MCHPLKGTRLTEDVRQNWQICGEIGFLLSTEREDMLRGGEEKKGEKKKKVCFWIATKNSLEFLAGS